ncbi:MAG TPA: aminotransferase class V-fold PLP-dependent enzyme [Gemmatimonadaceae bacterium]|nr:aminotransferase class V-fold PLP-dependent enzyme [Gemmatimonadaceae bacterium]
MRREFVGTLAGAAGAVRVGLPPVMQSAGASASQLTSPEEWRRLFPALDQTVNGKPLVYLDSAATSLRPQPVIDALVAFYSGDNANPGATLHTLAQRANAAYEGARNTVAEFIGAADASEVLFTRGTTDGLNLVAASWGGANLKRGDEILIGIAEHASNMAPWQAVAAKTGAKVVYFDIEDSGDVDMDDFASKLSPRTRVVAFSHVSNVLGVINPARALCDRARASGRIVVVDGAQSVPHIPVNVREIGCDFLAFSSHKMLGPMGTGVLWGRRDLLDAMPPYQSGSNMAHDVDVDSMHPSEGALKFGAGTPNVAGAIGLAAAIRLIRAIGHDAIRRHEQEIARRMLARLSAIREVRVLGAVEAEKRIAVFSFTVAQRQPLDVLRMLDAQGIAIRAGDLASLPLLKRCGVERAARASCYLYTTEREVDAFADVLERIARESD